jgi:hypothetical protein
MRRLELIKSSARIVGNGKPCRPAFAAARPRPIFLARGYAARSLRAARAVHLAKSGLVNKLAIVTYQSSSIVSIRASTV